MMKTLSRLEIILGGVLSLIFVIWSFDKCASVNSNRPAADEEQVTTPVTSVEDAPQNTTESTPTVETPTVTTTPANPTPTTSPTPPPTTTTTNYSSLYVVIDSLNMRDKPFLNSNVLMKLPVGMKVIYLNESSSFSQKITIDGQAYDEPWVKVQVPAGIVGWLYGGGVRPYKK